MEKSIVSKKHVRRGHVLRNVRPWVSEGSLENLRDDLQDKDWRSIGDGHHSIGSTDICVTVTQCENDLEYFDIEVN